MYENVEKGLFNEGLPYAIKLANRCDMYKFTTIKIVFECFDTKRNKQSHEFVLNYEHLLK